ncbi:pentatricopeptide repeat-containing protein [Pyrus ussuriensis x Pyrus communis]|uniref:Pentatricopeptide repeat-containing protein n=1 Tax=Pyrus ussuriensis x Pyrus communis TaxID=2448454 RepID=A0A5N5I132_9ROSA|nr:pentatricopeptide repeat-containing protein [Pyrus ussuriensis x Pyrus communis]
MMWHGPRFGLPCLGYLPRMKKLLQFDFSAAVDRVIKDGAAKIGAVEDELLDKQNVECKVVATP